MDVGNVHEWGRRSPCSEKEAIIVCSDNNVTTGITIWDMSTGEELSHRPTCASPRHGLICLGNQYLVAAQVQKPGSYTGGAIFIWALNKSQVLHRSYPVEPIGPLACTSDGAYIAGGTPSGKIIIWEVSTGSLLHCSSAHNKGVSCLVFSDDDSLLISGADDGVIHVWPLISMLNGEDGYQRSSRPPSLHSWTQHGSCISDLIVSTGGSNSILISCSLDCTCKVWSIGQGSLLQTFIFSRHVNAAILDPRENILFFGSADGTIFVHDFEIGLQESTDIAEDEFSRLDGHRGPVTALAFSSNGSYLISASEDCTAHIWDVSRGQIVRIIEHRKGQITNIMVVPQTSLLSKGCQKISSRGNLPRIPVSSLEKASCTRTAFGGTVTLLPSYCSLEERIINFQSATSMKKQIIDLEQERTPGAIQFKVETSVDHRVLMLNMVKHLVNINKDLQSKFIQMVQCQPCSKSNDPKEKKRKRLHIDSS